MDMEGVHVHGEGGEVEVHEVGVFAFVDDIGAVKVGWPEVGEDQPGGFLP